MDKLGHADNIHGKPFNLSAVSSVHAKLPENDYHSSPLAHFIFFDDGESYLRRRRVLGRLNNRASLVVVTG